MHVRNDGELPTELVDTLELLTKLIAVLQVEGDSNTPKTQEVMSALQQRPNLAELPAAILKAYNEIASALTGIRLTRETIQSHALERLADSTSRLTEVTSTTESAAIAMMNGLDRTLGVIDQLEQQYAEPAGGQADAPGFDSLRNAVNDLFGPLQFQDIIAQQLRGVMDLLTDVEGRITTVANLFDKSLTGVESASLPATPAAAAPSYNPDASVRDVETRQAIIDQAFEENQAPDVGLAS